MPFYEYYKILCLIVGIRCKSNLDMQQCLVRLLMLMMQGVINIKEHLEGQGRHFTERNKYMLPQRRC